MITLEELTDLLAEIRHAAETRSLDSEEVIISICRGFGIDYEVVEAKAFEIREAME